MKKRVKITVIGSLYAKNFTNVISFNLTATNEIGIICPCCLINEETELHRDKELA